MSKKIAILKVAFMVRWCMKMERRCSILKKKSLQSLSKGIGYSTAVFFAYANHGSSLSKNGYFCDSSPSLRMQ